MLLWVGKLIIDEVVLQIASETKEMSQLWILLGIELVLAVVSDLLSRMIGLMDGLLGDLYANKSSVELIQKDGALPAQEPWASMENIGEW